MNFIQWPAMLGTVIAAWLIGAQSRHRRKLGIWCFMLSNALWIAWGRHDQAYALIALKLAQAALNIRGAHKNEPG